MSKTAKKLLLGTALSSVIALPGCAYQAQSDSPPASALVAQSSTTIESRPTAAPKVMDGASFYHILLAELALMNDRPEVALELFLAAWEDYPNDAALLQRLAPLAARLGNPQLSLQLFQNWAQTEPQQLSAWHGLWQIAINQQEPIAASLAAANLLRLNPNYDLNIPFRAILTWDADTAQSFYAALVMQNTALNERNEGIKLFGVLQTQAGAPANAKTYWELLSTRLTDPNSLYTSAQSLFALGLLEGSWVLISTAHQQSPEDPKIAHLMANILSAQNEPKLALQRLMPWLEKPPYPTELLLISAELAVALAHPRRDEWLAALLNTTESDSARLLLAEVAIAREDFEQARTWLNEIRDSAHAVAATTLLISSLNQAPLAETKTVTLFEQWRHRFSNAPMQMLEQQARYWYDTGFYERAYDAYSLGLRVNPNDFFFLYMRAMSAEPLNRLDTLEQDLQRILHLDANNTAALNALGYTLLDRTDRIAEAAPMIEQAYAQNPDSFAITDSLGWLRFKQGRYEEAVEILARALAMQDESLDDDEVVSHYVEALWRNGQNEEARAVSLSWLNRFSATNRLKSLLLELGIKH